MKPKLSFVSVSFGLLTLFISLVLSESTDSFGRKSRGLVYLEPFSGGYDYAPSGGYDYKPSGGYGYGWQPKKGYVYPKPTTTTTTTTTTPEPAIEDDVEADAESITPEPPRPVEPEREIEASPDVIEEEDPWDIRDSVPGSPGDNYPVYGHIPKTSFSCENRGPGFYADPETRCQVFHRCGSDVRATMDSFLCSNGTQFNQEILSCDWWENVECEDASKYYSLNQELHQVGPDGSYKQFSGMRRVQDSPKVLTGIIPKSERQPLPSIYRSALSKQLNPEKPTATQTPITQTNNPIVFDTFRKPASPQSSQADATINNALNNPDYFNPEPPSENANTKTSQQSTVTSESGESGLSDDDYFANVEPLIETRTSFRKQVSEASKLDNDPLQPSTTSTTAKPSTSTTTSTTPKTTTSTQAPVKEEKPEPLIGFRAFSPYDNAEPRKSDNATGFIVNRPPPGSFNQLPPSGELDLEIQPPGISTDFDYNKVESNAERENSAATDEYLPPKNEYLPPTTTLAPEYIPPTQDSYLPVREKDSYLPPEDTYGPPKDTYGPPKDSYYRKPSTGYGQPLAPVITYVSPPQPVVKLTKTHAVKYFQPHPPPVMFYAPPSSYGYPQPVFLNPYIPKQYSIVQPAPYLYNQHAAFLQPLSSKHSNIEIAPAQLVSYSHTTSKEEEESSFKSKPAYGAETTFSGNSNYF